MSHRILRSEKCQWESPCRSGGRLELMETDYDGKRWYRVVAVGPEMKDNLVRFGLPANIDHIKTLEEALEIFEEYLNGPENGERWDISGISHDIEGFIPNIYFDESIEEAAQTETSISGRTEKWSGPGGIMSFSPKNVREFAKSWKVSEKDAWNNVINHEFKHFEDNINRRSFVDALPFEGEKDAIHEGAESMLKGGAEVNVFFIVRHMMSYGADEKEAWNIVKQWMHSWKDKYPDFVFDSPNIFLGDAMVDELGRDILYGETRDLSDEDLARRRGLWNEEDESENVT